MWHIGMDPCTRGLWCCHSDQSGEVTSGVCHTYWSLPTETSLPEQWQVHTWISHDSHTHYTIIQHTHLQNWQIPSSLHGSFWRPSLHTRWQGVAGGVLVRRCEPVPKPCLVGQPVSAPPPSPVSVGPRLDYSLGPLTDVAQIPSSDRRTFVRVGTRRWAGVYNVLQQK